MSRLISAAALSAALAVAAGAFGAHGASPAAAELLRTGGHYQLIHAVAALASALLGARGPGSLFVAGGTIFAVSLYLIALGLPGWLGAVTPIGGAMMVAGWLWLAWIGARAQRPTARHLSEQ